MSEEETDALYNEILKLPKVERPITATTQCEINVTDLFDTIRAFRKIPDYNELIKDNRKKGKEIERLKEDNKYLNKVNIELSSRNSKAMKYINEKENNDDNWIDYELLIEPIVLIDILRGSDKE